MNTLYKPSLIAFLGILSFTQYSQASNTISGCIIGGTVIQTSTNNSSSENRIENTIFTGPNNATVIMYDGWTPKAKRIENISGVSKIHSTGNERLGILECPECTEEKLVIITDPETLKCITTTLSRDLFWNKKLTITTDQQCAKSPVELYLQLKKLPSSISSSGSVEVASGSIIRKK